MAKVCFPCMVKHNGIEHAANVPFEVPDKEVSALVTQGGWLIEEKQPVRGTRKASKKETSEE